MCIFEITPCLHYLSDKNLEDNEYLKLFVFYGAIFDAPPDLVGEFTAYLESHDRISPRKYRAEELEQMRKKTVRPHAKRVNPYGCYDITRYGTFFNVNVPRSICQGCPYSVSYKNARMEKEEYVLASILQNRAIPDKIRLQMELSDGKAAGEMMQSVFMVQGKGVHKSKFDMISLNAFLLRYLYANRSLSALEDMDSMTAYIKDKIKTYFLKDKESVNSSDYIYETLCNEFARINRMDISSAGSKERLEEAVAWITQPYRYDRNDAIRVIRDKIRKPAPAVAKPQTFSNNVPFVIEPVDVPLVSGMVSIIDDSPVQDRDQWDKDHPEKDSEDKSGKTVQHETIDKPAATNEKLPTDPERYYPENYRIDSRQIQDLVSVVCDIQGFPFIKEVGKDYVMAAEKCSYSGKDGLLVCADDGKFYFYGLEMQSDNKAARELIRRRPMIITMNSAELHALLKKYRFYEGRTADLKDMYATLNMKETLPHTYRTLMEKMSGVELDGDRDFYLSAMKLYKQTYLSWLEKIQNGGVWDLFESYSCVSAAIGCSWDTEGIFKDIPVLYRRKNLFEYQSMCPETVVPGTEGSLYLYRTEDVPAKNERFCLGLVRELVMAESVKLGKVLVLKISDRGLWLFAFETNGMTYELLQWPCVYLARKLDIKNSHVHYHRQVYYSIQDHDKSDKEGNDGDENR